MMSPLLRLRRRTRSCALSEFEMRSAATLVFGIYAGRDSYLPYPPLKEVCSFAAPTAVSTSRCGVLQVLGVHLGRHLTRVGEGPRTHRPSRLSKLGHEYESLPARTRHPLLRIDAPSLYAPSLALPFVDPTVLRSYPLSCASCYQPKHASEHLVASEASLAGAQTTPPKTQKSSPGRKLNVSGGFGVVLGSFAGPRRIRRGRCRGASERPRGDSGRPRGSSGRCRGGGLGLA